MKKNIFVSLGVLSLLFAGAAVFAKKPEVKETKADGDPVEVTLNFNSFRSNSGNANEIQLRFTPENDIPTNNLITQVSRDAFWLNGVPTKDDGDAVIEKTGAYTYAIYIDRIHWGKYHDLIQANDVILVQGQWQSVHETTTYNVTVTPIYLQYTGSGWTRLEEYDIDLNLSIDQGRKTNKNELYFTPTAENPIPHNGWNIRMNSSANDCLQLNGAAASSTTQIIKVLEYCYLVYLPDAGFSIETNDVVKIQGTYVYSTPLLSFHINVKAFSAQWNGTEWVKAVEYPTYDDLPANSLLRNLGKYKANGASGNAIKGLDQTPETLLYRRDSNGNVGYLFTQSTAASTCEFRFYMGDNDYYGENYGHAIRSVSFDYMITNTASPKGTEGGASLTATGDYIEKDANEAKTYMIQFISKNRVNYYCFDVDLVADGELHSFTLNIAFSDVTGFNFKVFGFFGSFFISNLTADYDAYNQNLNNLVVDNLKMYSYKTGNNSCLSYYDDAKNAYLNLTNDDKATFANNAAYASAKARLAAWAAANGDVLDANAGTITANSRAFYENNKGNNAIVITVVLVSSSMILLGTLLILRKKRRHN